MRGVLRGVPWGPLAWLTAGGAALLGGASGAPRSVLGVHLVGLGFAVLAAAGAFALDEPAAAVVDATPYRLAVRTAVRATVLFVPLTVGVGGLSVLNVVDGSMPFWGRCLELLGVMVVALAGAAAVRRRRATPGESVGSTVALVVVGISLFDPLARWVPLLPVASDGRWGRTVVVWAVVIAAAVAVLGRAGRDPLDG